MKITRYMGAFAVIAMLAACSTDDELGTNTAANAVKIVATVGGNSIFTRSNPLGTKEEQTSFNENDAISVTTEGTTVIYKKTVEVWAPVNAAEFLLWTGNTQTFQACYPEKADENSTKNSFSAGYVSADQSTVEKIALSDYMTCTKNIEKVAIPSDRRLALNFERQTARVIIKVSAFGDEFYGQNPTLSAVEVYSKLKVPAGESDSYVGIQACKKDNVFYALVSPGSANSTEKFLKLTVTYNDGEGNPTQAKELYVTGIPALEKAESYTYDVRIGKDNAIIGSVSVTDWSTGSVIKGGDAVTTTENALLVIEKALAANKKNIEITLDADAGRDVLKKIKDALSSADDGSIELTVNGVETLCAEAFLECTQLKSINLPNVKSIGQSAFYSCYNMEAVNAPNATSIGDMAFAACSRLGKVTLGNISKAGTQIFDIIDTKNSIDLVLSGDQRKMSYKYTETEWEPDPDGKNYKDSSEHVKCDFLGYRFKSISCGDKKYNLYS